jgi:hypothetical protein
MFCPSTTVLPAIKRSPFWPATDQSQSFPSIAIDSEAVNPLFEYERKLLLEFISFSADHKDVYWVHWAMRTSTFGWAHLRDRMKVHGIDSSALPPMSHILDLSNFLNQKYGPNFAEHGRLYNLIKGNHLKHPDLLDGQAEVDLAAKLELGPIRNSCFRKVDRIAKLLKLECLGKIKLRRPIRMWLAGSLIAIVGFIWWIGKEFFGGLLQAGFQSIFRRP